MKSISHILPIYTVTVNLTIQIIPLNRKSVIRNFRLFEKNSFAQNRFHSYGINLHRLYEKGEIMNSAYKKSQSVKFDQITTLPRRALRNKGSREA